MGRFCVLILGLVLGEGGKGIFCGSVLVLASVGRCLGSILMVGCWGSFWWSGCGIWYWCLFVSWRWRSDLVVDCLGHSWCSTLTVVFGKMMGVDYGGTILGPDLVVDSWGVPSGPFGVSSMWSILRFDSGASLMCIWVSMLVG